MTAETLHRLHRAGFSRIIGLAGSIGTGKSHAREHLQTLGALCVDADKLAHQLYEPGTPTFEQVCNAFGRSNVVDGTGKIDRKRLGNIVFKDPQELDKLNAIIWPQMEHKTSTELLSLLDTRQHSDKNVGVIEAAVLLEAGWNNIVDEVWLTVCERETQIERIMDRNNLSREEAENRLFAQSSSEEKMKKSDVIIDTSGPKEQTKRFIEMQYNLVLNSRT